MTDRLKIEAGDKRIVAVDFDDVLVETSKVVVRAYEEWSNGIRVDPKHASNAEHPSWEADSTTVLAFQRKVLQSLLPEPVDGAREGLEQLIASGWEPHLVTSRSERLCQATTNALGEHFPGLFPSECQHYLGYDGSKGKFCRQLGAALIDDSLGNLKDAAKHGVSPIGFDPANNYPTDQYSRVMYYATWREVVEVLGE